MAENKKLQAIGRLKTRIERAGRTIGADVGTWGPGAPGGSKGLPSPPPGVSEVVGGLAGVWDSPKAQEIALGINTTVSTARARVADAYLEAVSAESAELEENTETVDDDSDEAKPKWDA